MKIRDHLENEAVIELSQSTTEGVIVELVQASHRIYKFSEPIEQVIEVVRARERIGSTGLGGGVAIPHAQFKHMTTEMILVGRSTDGISFGSADERPVHIFFLLLGPQDVKRHLAMLATLARLCKSDEFLERCLACQTTESLHELLVTTDE